MGRRGIDYRGNRTPTEEVRQRRERQRNQDRQYRRSIKAALDPKGLMNPGKIARCPTASHCRGRRSTRSISPRQPSAS
ncbi:FAD-linked oxidase C-terminal domain-containing protein [Bradyrhizobium sp. CCBAU 53421]|uniref:FAD-linked oxidase C-terminal domain-containing protein n=1 Tax=Bradyrhizobium sp. CCBAU 53421 TaxID=1325120 RepID=UPI00188C0849|nr:hypothetical protein XH92_20265 [Bradyrhizobium sp. CCBAU 53421]